MLKTIIPDQVESSDINERNWSLDEEDEEEWENFVENIRRNGIAEPPIVRTVDGGGYEVIIGQRRIEAAKEAGLDQIEVIVRNWDDGDALTRSISENIPEFKKNVEPSDRALALHQLAELSYDGDDFPPQSWFVDKLGVSQSTISRWMKPLNDCWAETVIDPTTDKGGHISAGTFRGITGTKLSSIERTTGGGENGIWLAEKTVEHDLTIQDLAQVRRHFNDGASLENAVGLVTGDLSLDDVGLTEEEEPEETEEAADPEPDEDEEEEASPKPAESPDTTSTAETSTAELSQGTTSSWSSSDDGETATASTTETPSPETETEETEEEDVEVDEGLPERYQGRDLVASEEQIEKMQEMQEEENGSFASTLEAVDEEAAEDGPTVEVEGFELHGRMAEAAMETFEQDMFEDGQDLARFAVEKMLREGNWA